MRHGSAAVADDAIPTQTPVMEMHKLNGIIHDDVNVLTNRTYNNTEKALGKCRPLPTR